MGSLNYLSVKYSRLHWGIIKKFKTLLTNPLIHGYISRINNRLVLEIKAWFTNAWNHEIIWWYKTLIEKTKNGENVPSIELIEVLLR